MRERQRQNAARGKEREERLAGKRFQCGEREKEGRAQPRW